MERTTRPTTLAELRSSGWKSRSVKDEVRENFLRMLRDGAELFPGIVGYDDTVIPEINIALLAGHDMLFLGEKGQAKSRLMRLLVRFLDESLPYLDDPAIPLHDDPEKPITSAGRRLVASRDPQEIPIAWWPRAERYAERLAPARSLPTSSARSTRPGWRAARACRARRPCTSASSRGSTGASSP
jgi:magnesium chelatase subunit I